MPIVTVIATNVGSISTRGNEIFKIKNIKYVTVNNRIFIIENVTSYFFALATKHSDSLSSAIHDHNASRIQGKVGNGSVLMRTECFNTGSPY